MVRWVLGSFSLGFRGEGCVGVSPATVGPRWGSSPCGQVLVLGFLVLGLEQVAGVRGQQSGGNPGVYGLGAAAAGCGGFGFRSLALTLYCLLRRLDRVAWWTGC